MTVKPIPMSDGFIVERDRDFLLGGRASIIEDSRELAWVERRVSFQPDVKWVLGHFVQADYPNRNGHIFPLEDLRGAVASIINKPLNVNHEEHNIVGVYVDAELLEPGGEQAADVTVPHVDALAAFWKYYYGDLYKVVEKAHVEGALHFSMETVPRTITCSGVGENPGCAREFAYAGRVHESYCDHLNTPRSRKRLNRPHFTGGALILPPKRPGWADASVTELAEQFNEAFAADEAEVTYEGFRQMYPHLGPREWEAMMVHALNPELSTVPGLTPRGREIVASLRDRVEPERTIDELRETDADNAEQRRRWAADGVAMADGSFPIPNVAYLRKAIQAFGRAGDKAAAKRHIVKRAKALGATKLLPEGWA